MSSADSRQARRHNPLSEEYAPTEVLKQKAEKKRKGTRATNSDDNFVDSQASRQILKIGQDLIDEEELEQQKSRPNPAFEFGQRFSHAESGRGGFGDVDDEEEEEEEWGDEEEEIVEEIELDPEDQDIFNRFNPTHTDPLLDPDAVNNNQGTNLADLILEKIALHEAATANGSVPQPMRAESPMEEAPLPPKVVEVYTKVGELLSRHRSGPLPKPFKILPTLPVSQIPVLISLTNPDNWTPHVHYQATRMFISAKPSIAQPFLTSILLPKVRDDIHETKKLHLHLYSAVKKSLYKPACFFKGFLFPLLEDSNCTLREATIIGSVLTRVSVPVLHSAAALLRLCDIAAEQFSLSKEDGGGGATNIFIRVLLDKKYALPYKVVDALVFHFLRFKAIGVTATPSEDVSMGDAATRREQQASKLPVLWHQSLLAFAQRYRNDITEDQREALLDLVNAVGHKAIGPEVRRELLEGRGRGVPLAEEGTGDGGDDTMMMG